MSKNDVFLNDDIRASEVRCIGEDGEIGVISKEQALEIARKDGLDLVLVAPDAKPPVCKIMDYSKFRYQQEKKQKEARKKQKIIDVKEIKLSIKIAQNDINYKIKHAKEFIEDGKHVKFRVFLRGREMSNPEAGVELLNRVWDEVSSFSDRDKEPSFEGKYVNMLIVPKKAK